MTFEEKLNNLHKKHVVENAWIGVRYTPRVDVYVKLEDVKRLLADAASTTSTRCNISTCGHPFCMTTGLCYIDGWDKKDKPLPKPPDHSMQRFKMYFEPDLYKDEMPFVYCHYCGKDVPMFAGLPADRITKDHKIPVSKGGTNSKENILPWCHECNTLKASMDYIEYLQYRQLEGLPLSEKCKRDLEMLNNIG